MAREWITWEEAADLTGCPRGTLYKYMRAGHLQHRGKRVRRGALDRESVEQFAKRVQPLLELREQQKRARLARRERRLAVSGPPSTDDIWLKPSTAALVVGVSPQYLIRLAGEERVPAVRRGKRWWFRRHDVEQLAAVRAFEQRRALAS